MLKIRLKKKFSFIKSNSYMKKEILILLFRIFRYFIILKETIIVGDENFLGGKQTRFIRF